MAGELVEQPRVDVDGADAGFGLGVSDVEAGFGEVEVLVVELAELADSRPGEAQGGDDRTAHAKAWVVVGADAPVQVYGGRLGDAHTRGDLLPGHVQLVAEDTYERGLLERLPAVASAVELIGRVEEVEELIDLERAVAPAPLGWRSHPW